LKEEKIDYYTLRLGQAHFQISRLKVRIYAGEKRTFLKGAWHLTLSLP